MPTPARVASWMIAFLGGAAGGAIGGVTCAAIVAAVSCAAAVTQVEQDDDRLPSLGCRAGS
jgi:hypothetical protein